jgi:hypothetical protein
MRKLLIFLSVILIAFLGAFVFGPKFALVCIDARNLPGGEVQIAPEKPVVLKAGSSWQFHLIRLHKTSELKFTCISDGQVTQSQHGYFTATSDQFIVRMQTRGCQVTQFTSSGAIANAMSLAQTPGAGKLATGGK